MVDDVKIDVFGNDVFPNAFSDVGVYLFFVKLAGLVELFQYRTVSINAPNFNFRVLLFQITTRTRNGASCAYSRNHVGDFTIGLSPNFRPGTFIMGLPVGEVVVLIAPVAIGNFFTQSGSYGIVGARVVGFHIGRTNDDLGTQGPQEVHFFFGLFVSRGENTFVAFHGSGNGQAHPGIAGSTFNDGAPGSQVASCFCIQYHFECHPVFDGVTRVESFYFHQYQCGHFRHNFMELNHGRIADGGENVLVVIHRKEGSRVREFEGWMFGARC